MGKEWSYKGSNIEYRDARHTPIEDMPMPHIKKKQKKNVRSKHKHIYIPAIYKNNSDIVYCGSHCKICGRINSFIYTYSKIPERLEKFKKEYPDYTVVYLPDNWDYFKDKIIPVNKNIDDKV